MRPILGDSSESEEEEEGVKVPLNKKIAHSETSRWDASPRTPPLTQKKRGVDAGGERPPRQDLGSAPAIIGDWAPPTLDLVGAEAGNSAKDSSLGVGATRVAKAGNRGVTPDYPLIVNPGSPAPSRACEKRAARQSDGKNVNRRVIGFETLASAAAYMAQRTPGHRLFASMDVVEKGRIVSEIAYPVFVKICMLDPRNESGMLDEVCKYLKRKVSDEQK